MTALIHAQTPADFREIAKLADQIWTQHYTPIIGSDQVRYMVDKFQSAAAIEEQVENGIYYYLMLHPTEPAGYFSYELKEDHLFLSKLYVLKSMRGKRIGQTAMTFMQAQARANGLNKIRLTVNKNNSDSIAAYLGWGFKNVDSVVMDIGNGFVMDDFILEKELFTK